MPCALEAQTVINTFCLDFDLKVTNWTKCNGKAPLSLRERHLLFWPCFITHWLPTARDKECPRYPQYFVSRGSWPHLEVRTEAGTVVHTRRSSKVRCSRKATSSRNHHQRAWRGMKPPILGSCQWWKELTKRVASSSVVLRSTHFVEKIGAAPTALAWQKGQASETWAKNSSQTIGNSSTIALKATVALSARVGVILPR